MGAVVLIVLVILVAWFINVRRRPFKTCRTCNGRGRLPGFIVGTHADCRRCGTKGRVRRLGAGRES